jgi:AhpD family alkylhydroperoxidase
MFECGKMEDMEEMMEKMMGDFPPKIMMEMMPECLEKILSKLPEEERAKMVKKLLSILQDKEKTERTKESKGETAPDRLRSFEKNVRDLSKAQPDIMKVFWELRKAAVATNALNTKTKELIALAISVATQCDDCIVHHVYDVLKAGATKEEITDALGVAILMGGGRSVVYATHTIEAVNQFTEGTS